MKDESEQSEPRLQEQGWVVSTRGGLVERRGRRGDPRGNILSNLPESADFLEKKSNFSLAAMGSKQPILTHSCWDFIKIPTIFCFSFHTLLPFQLLLTPGAARKVANFSCHRKVSSGFECQNHKIYTYTNRSIHSIYTIYM